MFSQVKKVVKNRIVLISFLVILLVLVGRSPSFATTVINEDFNSISDWTDLSTAITWGGNSKATSVFTTDGGSAHLTSTAFDYTTKYNSADTLKTFTALDREFSPPIDHVHSIVTIDFRAKWNSLVNVGDPEEGRFVEGGRFIIILNYDYPEGGLDTSLDNKFNKFDRQWWARPAYHVRIRAGSTSNMEGTTLLQYGGGLTTAGEYETYDDKSTPQNPDWWLAGFISGAKGVSPGKGSDYPANSWVKTSTGLATTLFRNYRYVIKPDVQEIWFDADDDGIFQNNELVAMMPLPSTNKDGAPLYQYFPKFEGIRLFWRGANGEDRGQVFLDKLTVTVKPLS